MNGKEAQVAYSKHQLCSAFLQLLATNRYEEIPISEILEVAGISRRTFYRHFSNKQALLDYYFEQLLDEYLLEKERILQAQCLEEMLAVSFEFWYQKRDILQILLKNRQFDSLVEMANKKIGAIYQMIQAPWHVSQRLGQENIDDVLRFLVGGYCNILRGWLLQKEMDDPSKLARNVKELFANISKVFFAPHKETSDRRSERNGGSKV